MLRRKVEASIDQLLSLKMRDPSFLRHTLSVIRIGLSTVKTATVPLPALKAKLRATHGRRDRVLDSYIEGEISKEVKSQKLRQIEQEIRTLQQGISERETRRNDLNLETLMLALQPFTEWEFLSYEDKRKLLTVMSAEIRIWRYNIYEVKLKLTDSQVISITPDQPEEQTEAGTTVVQLDILPNNPTLV